MQTIRGALVVDVNGDGYLIGPGLEAGEADLLLRHDEWGIGGSEGRGAEKQQ